MTEFQLSESIAGLNRQLEDKQSRSKHYGKEKSITYSPTKHFFGPNASSDRSITKEVINAPFVPKSSDFSPSTNARLQR